MSSAASSSVMGLFLLFLFLSSVAQFLALWRGFWEFQFQRTFFRPLAASSDAFSSCVLKSVNFVENLLSKDIIFLGKIVIYRYFSRYSTFLNVLSYRSRPSFNRPHKFAFRPLPFQLGTPFRGRLVRINSLSVIPFLSETASLFPSVCILPDRQIERGHSFICDHKSVMEGLFACILMLFSHMIPQTIIGCQLLEAYFALSSSE